MAKKKLTWDSVGSRREDDRLFVLFDRIQDPWGDTEPPPLVESILEHLVSQYRKFDLLHHVDVVQTGGGFYLWDGRHRLEVAKRVGRKDVAVEVSIGSQSDCLELWAKRGPTLKIGKRRRDYTQFIIKEHLRRNPLLSDSEIARVVKVDHKTVARLRREILGNSPDAPRVVTRNGKQYQMRPSGRSTAPKAIALPSVELGTEAHYDQVMSRIMDELPSYLRSCPAYSRLAGGAKSRFCREVIHYRMMTEFYLPFKNQPELKDRFIPGTIGSIGGTAWHTSDGIENSPQKWTDCTACKDDDGLSRGNSPIMLMATRKCRSCRGTGYILRKPDTGNLPG